MENEDKRLEPMPIGAVRGRCWCTWWITTRKQLYNLFCPACGINLRPCTDRDYIDAGVENVLSDHRAGEVPLKKTKKQKEMPEPAPDNRGAFFRE